MVKRPLTRNAAKSWIMMGGMSSIEVGQRPRSARLLSRSSHGAARLYSSFATGSLVRTFQYPVMPVTRATRTTSSSGYCLMAGMRRNDLAHCRDALMNNAPAAPPSTPTMMKLPSSKYSQSITYRIWNMTILWVP